MSFSVTSTNTPYVAATALHLAACRGDIPLIDLLFERGADLAARDGHYEGTPADWAEEYHQDAARRHLQDVAASRRPDVSSTP
jgi:ankyrin repeat protein